MRYVYGYLNDKVTVRHRIPIRVAGAEVPGPFVTADCGNGPIWFDPQGWRGWKSKEEVERVRELRDCKRCAARAEREGPTEFAGQQAPSTGAADASGGAGH